MSPNGGGQPSGDLADAINSSFGSFEEFKTHFQILRLHSLAQVGLGCVRKMEA